jgi:hypothetical protein
VILRNAVYFSIALSVFILAEMKDLTRAGAELHRRAAEVVQVRYTTRYTLLVWGWEAKKQEKVWRHIAKDSATEEFEAQKGRIETVLLKLSERYVCLPVPVAVSVRISRI